MSQTHLRRTAQQFGCGRVENGPVQLDSTPIQRLPRHPRGIAATFSVLELLSFPAIRLRRRSGGVLATSGLRSRISLIPRVPRARRRVTGDVNPAPVDLVLYARRYRRDVKNRWVTWGALGGVT